MGSINISRASAVESLTEIVGFRAGLIIEPEHLHEMLKDYDPELASVLGSHEDRWLRFHSSTFQDIVAHLLFKVGNIDDPSTVPLSIRMYHKSKADPAKLERHLFIMQAFNDAISEEIAKNPAQGKSLDPSSFMRIVAGRYGREGLKIAMELIVGMNRQLHISPWGSIRETEWNDAIELSGLFQSEDLGTLHGRFFDQRFIDYLRANFESIDRIHWRKFEGLAGEFFEREGFTVDIGPSRNDDGIDLRIYPRDTGAAKPPLIIVQCKRQKEKIGKTLLKSVYADVIHEGANSGLIVTSSWLARGTETMRKARSYPIEAADRDTLRSWIEKLKTDTNAH